MDKEAILQKIQDCGLVAVVRAETPDKALRIADACIEAGVAGIELTYTVPGASKIIERLAQEYQGSTDFIVGAGTVNDSATARIAILSGAQYLVSPYLDEGMIATCHSYRVASMAGAMTVWEIAQAVKAGTDIVKLFPGDILGPRFIKLVHGPMPYVKMMPTGGVTVDNAAEWIKAGAVALGAGATLTFGADSGDYACVKKTARQFLENIKNAREQA